MIKINLLPPEKRKKAKRAAPVPKKEGAAPARPSLGAGLNLVVLMPAITALLVILFIASTFFWFGYQEDKFNEQRKGLRVQLNQLNMVIMRIDELKKRTSDVVNRMNVIVQVDKNRYVWPRTLDDISSSLPRYTWLQTISEVSPFPELTMRIEGYTMSNILLSELLMNLEKKESLTDVKLISSSENKVGNYNTKYFVIECASKFNQPSSSTGQVAQAK